jgi:hypothetical protein
MLVCAPKGRDVVDLKPLWNFSNHVLVGSAMREMCAITKVNLTVAS